MYDTAAYNAIRTNAANARWIGSWSNNYSLWDVDGKPFYFAKRHHHASEYIPKMHRHDLMSHPLKRVTEERELLERWRGMLHTLGNFEAEEELTGTEA